MINDARRLAQWTSRCIHEPAHSSSGEIGSCQVMSPLPVMGNKAFEGRMSEAGWRAGARKHIAQSQEYEMGVGGGGVGESWWEFRNVWRFRCNGKLTFSPYGQMWPPPQLIFALEPSQDLSSGVAVAQSLAAHFVSKADVLQHLESAVKVLRRKLVRRRGGSEHNMPIAHSKTRSTIKNRGEL